VRLLIWIGADEFLDEIKREILKKVVILPCPEWDATLGEVVERMKREAETVHP